MLPPSNQKITREYKTGNPCVQCIAENLRDFRLNQTVTMTKILSLKSNKNNLFIKNETLIRPKNLLIKSFWGNQT